MLEGDVSMRATTIERVLVVGAGQMGHQIAMLCALGGFQTVLQDVSEEALARAEQSLQKRMAQWVNGGKVTAEKRDAAFSQLTFSTDLAQAASEADLVIEAIIEKLDTKQQLFKQLDELTPAHAILATNSSTIVNSLLAVVTSRPGQVCNMHFFFPPLVMDCVEVVMSEQTSEATAQTALAFCDSIGRTGALLRKEISGFVANRILGAIHREAISLYEQGIADFKDIDFIVKKSLGHPLGPFELMDLSGIDVIGYVMQQQYEESGDLAHKIPPCIQEKIQAGHLGRKTEQGFYTYEARQKEVQQ